MIANLVALSINVMVYRDVYLSPALEPETGENAA
jgi:hypothetical protein